MRQLETSFTKNGFSHLQIKRIGNIAVYERGLRDATHYEVIRIGSHNGFELKDKDGNPVKIPPAETYPTAEQWGVSAFTFTDHDSAEEKFNEMTAAEKAKS